MIVSLFTDASFCPDTQVGGWGCWIKSDRRQFTTGSPFRNLVTGANAAEMRALANGLRAALQFGIAEKGDKIIAQVDNMHVVGLMSGRNYKMKGDEREAKEKIERLVRDNDLTLEVRHVKGHATSRGGRNRANGVADRIARSKLEKARRKIQ